MKNKHEHKTISELMDYGQSLYEGKFQEIGMLLYYSKKLDDVICDNVSLTETELVILGTLAWNCLQKHKHLEVALSDGIKQIKFNHWEYYESKTPSYRKKIVNGMYFSLEAGGKALRDGMFMLEAAVKSFEKRYPGHIDKADYAENKGDRTMTTNTEKFPLTEVAEGRIDDAMFSEFLHGYGYYWHHCHAEGHFNEEILHNAEQNAIAYAKGKELRLEFGEMDYKLEAASEPQEEMPTGTEKSCFAPRYSELSSIVKEAIELISTMWPKEPEDVEGIAFWLKRNKRFLKGSQRVVKARQMLHEKYDHTLVETERERDINELLWTYQHLFYYVTEEEYDAERNITRFLIEIDLGEFLPPFDEHGMKEDEVIEYSHKILERMLDLGMLTEVGQDDTGKMTLYINEPENW